MSWSWVWRIFEDVHDLDKILSFRDVQARLVLLKRKISFKQKNVGNALFFTLTLI